MLKSMALFVRKQPSVSDTPPLYTVGAQKTVLIVGLGNLGKEYQGTRHNLGFQAIDFFAQQNDFPTWNHKKDLKADITVHNLGECRVILAKPTTYMNNSGEAVQAISQFYKLSATNTLIVHDEIDVPWGQIRLRQGGGSAGHNGLKSVIAHGGEQTGRVRIGIANAISAQADSADFVLAKLRKAEQAKLPALLQEVNSILTEYIFGGSLPTETRSFI